jgi:hypothetical protein
MKGDAIVQTAPFYHEYEDGKSGAIKTLDRLTSAGCGYVVNVRSIISVHVNWEGQTRVWLRIDHRG